MLEAAVLRAAITGQTNRDLAREFGVHYQTVQNMRRKLKKSGVLEPAHRGKKAPQGSVGLVGRAADEAEHAGKGLMPWRISDMADFINRLPDLRELTDQEKVNLLSYLSLHAVGPTQVSAVRALDDLQAAIKSRKNISLALPVTREEKLDRLRRMCEVVGEDLWLEALEVERARQAEVEAERLARGRSVAAVADGETEPVVTEERSDTPASFVVASADSPSPTENGLP